MHRTVSNLIVIVISGLLFSACSQKQQAAQQPASIPLEAGSAVPMGAGTGVPGLVSQMTPATPTVIVSAADGQLVVTRDFQGQTVTLTVGDSFLLNLGDGYGWEIAVSDENVISPTKNGAVIHGVQGIYTALKAGTVTIRASGDPLCRQSKPACGMPSILLDFTVVVK